MALLSLFEIEKQFGERTLFSGVTFEMAPGDRLGLVGVNGCGKSTLLKLIAGEERPDAGRITRSAELRIQWMQQRGSASAGATLYEDTLQVFCELLAVERQLDEIAEKLTVSPDEKLIRRQAALQERYDREGGATFRSRTRAVLLGLGFTEADLLKPLSLFSGGEARKALLARVLLSDATLLLLDEPTNHLDLSAIEWLEEYLLSYKGAYIVVSHDRFFLDRVTERTAEMENGHVTLHRGNYSRHLELKMSERETVERRYYNQQKEIRRLQAMIEQQKRWNQARNYVTIASKEKQIERIRAELVPPEKDPEAIGFHFQAVEPAGNEIISMRGLKKSFSGRTIFSGVEELILKGEHVCLLGSNGCGKTTLLNILRGAEEPDEGSFVIGANVRIGYYEQSMKGLDPAKTVLGQVSDLFPRMDLTELRTALGRFLFHGDDVFKLIGDLSGGELARIQLLKLMLEGCNLLLLDEPTNHLDIPSREALEKALSAYDGTMLVVTHDRYFVDRIADRVLILEKDGIREFSGDWTLYMQSLREREQERREEPAAEPARERVNEYQLKKQQRSDYLRVKNEAARLEKEIADLEGQLGGLHEKLQDPKVAADYNSLVELTEKSTDLEAALEERYLAWEQAEERLAGMPQGD